ncbi:BLUF domain-containing protein [Variovorax dokdonensis]|uniref:BLUF domain-containing protein n=1 Tax=Variovorax dokdonensis TaxID=344883 RepID=A0ABT7N5M1_9BURK|nr:BLUF domain-containing protein [Variovorax dokdonensis]MDM0043227.1 BLUF domain-containing protein [Variovorax dokdonensis]
MSQQHSALFQYFYVSQLASDASASTVPAILAQVRQGNARNGITGVLVFDGQSFMQYLEGPSGVLQGLMGQIAIDPRHARLQMLHEGALQERRCSRYELGYADPTADGALDQVLEQLSVSSQGGPPGEAAVQLFLSLRPRFDIEG